ncbi:MAG: hypothetical protein ACPLZG_09270 [Thermoproteota archaeon]
MRGCCASCGWQGGFAITGVAITTAQRPTTNDVLNDSLGATTLITTNDSVNNDSAVVQRLTTAVFLRVLHEIETAVLTTNDFITTVHV